MSIGRLEVCVHIRTSLNQSLLLNHASGEVNLLLGHSTKYHNAGSLAIVRSRNRVRRLLTNNLETTVEPLLCDRAHKMFISRY